MTQKNTGGPAFPGKVMEPDMGDPDTGETLSWRDDDNPGMTLRDYFAGQALAGIISTLATASPSAIDGAASEDGFRGQTRGEYTAFRSYQIADLMIQARNK